MPLKDPFEDLRGLEGLYVFVNHPARVTVYKGHKATFGRLMHESAQEIQQRRLQSALSGKKLVSCCADNGQHSHWNLIDETTGETLWSEDLEHETNPINLAMKYLEENIKSLKTYKVMGEFIEWLQAKNTSKKEKPTCVGVSTCGGCDMSCPAHPDTKKEKRTPEFYEDFYKSVTTTIRHLDQ